MARKVRVEYPGAVYHVMSRGNLGGAIFRTDRDRRLLLETIAEGCEKTGWRIHAYVLMPNHYVKVKGSRNKELMPQDGSSTW